MFPSLIAMTQDSMRLTVGLNSSKYVVYPGVHGHDLHSAATQLQSIVPKLSLGTRLR